MKSKKTGFCDYGAAIATLGEETAKAPLKNKLEGEMK